MWLKLPVFCFVVLFYADLFDYIDALKSGDEGVCVVKISTRKTRTKIVNKWCGKKKCAVKKIETYTIPEERIVCCNGWEYDVKSDACSAICSTGCAGGRCVAPEVCHCDPPATLHPEHKNTCVQPTCDPPCANAQCVLNNTCQCYPTYSIYNSTHCFKCETGYTLEDFNCIPVCNKSCVNSNCTAPNTCSCLEGYKKVNDNICEPVCDVCVNGTCTAPNTCSCLDGFEKVNDTTCVPKCTNCDGDCVGPNVCRCRTGYKNIDGVCKPECGTCENGVCVAPGECSCNEGYKKNESNPSICINNCEQPSKVEET